MLEYSLRIIIIATLSLFISVSSFAQSSGESSLYDQEKRLKLKVHNAKLTKNSELILKSEKELVEFQLEKLEVNSMGYETKQLELDKINLRIINEKKTNEELSPKVTTDGNNETYKSNRRSAIHE